MLITEITELLRKKCVHRFYGIKKVFLEIMLLFERLKINQTFKIPVNKAHSASVSYRQGLLGFKPYYLQNKSHDGYKNQGVIQLSNFNKIVLHLEQLHALPGKSDWGQGCLL